MANQCFCKEHSEKPDQIQKSFFEGSREMLRQELKGKNSIGRESHQGEFSSATAFTLGTFADSRCGQEAEILGFAPAEERCQRIEKARVSEGDRLVLNA